MLKYRFSISSFNNQDCRFFISYKVDILIRKYINNRFFYFQNDDDRDFEIEVSILIIAKKNATEITISNKLTDLKKTEEYAIVLPDKAINKEEGKTDVDEYLNYMYLALKQIFEERGIEGDLDSIFKDAKIEIHSNPQIYKTSRNRLN